MREEMPADVRSDVRAALRACRLWRAASDAAVDRLARLAAVDDVKRGTPLAVEGDPADRFGVVVVGRALVYALSPEGRRVGLETVGTGEPLGALAALSGGRYPYNIDATTPTSVAWLPREALFDLLAAEPEVARDLVTDLAGRVVHFTGMVQTLTLDVPSRLARYLFQRALQTGRTTPDGLEVDLGMRKGELAEVLGTVPETLSRAFSRLKADGVLTVSGSTVTIVDVRSLAALGSGMGGA
jgi:CRP-like cAMP-binding protein